MNKVDYKDGADMTQDNDIKYEDKIKQDTVVRMVKFFMIILMIVAFAISVAITVGLICLIGTGIWWLMSMMLGL